ncbi:MAG: ABC transporter ATP-binding protein [Actinomycetota bacterium]|jgi:peptide/nickel transport system ATP-binding protein|nr:ABC transporter ATP-binding protein [Actinomycetota bacterium]
MTSRQPEEVPLERVDDGPSPVPPADAPLLVVNDLQVRFPTDDGDLQAVRGVSWEVKEREVLGIVGESGCGKSVSSMALLGLLPPTARISGSAKFRGQELLGVPDREIRSLRGRKIAMIFQDPMTSMNPVYTVGGQLAEAVRAHFEMSNKAAMLRAIEMLDLVGIPNAKARAKSYPHEFSGGMRQRAMIAMAIINNPDVIIADEPTTALDVTVQAQILETLQEVKEEVGAAIILITHDLGVIAGMADRVKVMYAGRIVESGTAEQIFDTPRMPYAAGLLGSIPSMEGASDVLTPILGTPPSLVNPPEGCPFVPRCPLAIDECHHDEPDLLSTDQPEHEAACIRWEHLATVEDPRLLFRTGDELVDAGIIDPELVSES